MIGFLFNIHTLVGFMAGAAVGFIVAVIAHGKSVQQLEEKIKGYESKLGIK